LGRDGQRGSSRSVPISDDFCHNGMATATFSVTQNAEVRAGVSSIAWRDRATMAVYACYAARLGIDTEHPEYHSS
jgi:hypothetical protein